MEARSQLRRRSTQPIHPKRLTEFQKNPTRPENWHFSWSGMRSIQTPAHWAVACLGRRESPVQISPPRPSKSLRSLCCFAPFVVMPTLARAQRRVARMIASSAFAADAMQAEPCLVLSAILHGGLILNATVGWWWAVPAARLLMTPIVLRVGLNGLKGRSCCDCCSSQASAAHDCGATPCRTVRGAAAPLASARPDVGSRVLGQLRPARIPLVSPLGQARILVVRS